MVNFGGMKGVDGGQNKGNYGLEGLEVFRKKIGLYQVPKIFWALGGFAGIPPITFFGGGCGKWSE